MWRGRSRFTPTSAESETSDEKRPGPVLSGVAEWIISRVAKTGRGYEVRASMGIAEREHMESLAWWQKADIYQTTHALSSMRTGTVLEI